MWTLFGWRNGSRNLCQERTPVRWYGTESRHRRRCKGESCGGEGTHEVKRPLSHIGFGPAHPEEDVHLLPHFLRYQPSHREHGISPAPIRPCRCRLAYIHSVFPGPVAAPRRISDMQIGGAGDGESVDWQHKTGAWRIPVRTAWPNVLSLTKYIFQPAPKTFHLV